MKGKSKFSARLLAALLGFAKERVVVQFLKLNHYQRETDRVRFTHGDCWAAGLGLEGSTQAAHLLTANHDRLGIRFGVTDLKSQGPAARPD